VRERLSKTHFPKRESFEMGTQNSAIRNGSKERGHVTTHSQQVGGKGERERLSGGHKTTVTSMRNTKAMTSFVKKGSFKERLSRIRGGL